VEVIDKYGADALRLYLINSPVVRAETLRFKEEGVFGVVKDVFLPWYNAYRFLVQNVLRMETETGQPFRPAEVRRAAAAAGARGGGVTWCTVVCFGFVGVCMLCHQFNTPFSTQGVVLLQLTSQPSPARPPPLLTWPCPAG
jgi:hypothetical protein